MTKNAAADQADGNTNGGNGKVSVSESSTDIWTLEDVFPEVGGLLSPSEGVTAADNDVLVVLDTNALLLPFSVGKQELPQINRRL